jgi:glutathione S-transferase
MNSLNTPKVIPTLWHCYNARSLRPLWALEEMGIEYQLNVMSFPPRFTQREYLEVNVLGTIPFFDDGRSQMTESSAICQYLVDVYDKAEFGIAVDDPDYGRYLNFLHQSDTTLTFPLALVLRYRHLETNDRKLPQIAEDYIRWFLARLRWLEQQLSSGKMYLCGNKFTIADIAVGYALHFSSIIGLKEHLNADVSAYLARLTARNAFKRAMQKGVELDPFKSLNY